MMQGNNNHKKIPSNQSVKSGGPTLPPTHPKKAMTGSAFKAEKVAHLINGNASIPAIPGRTIRIIVNK